jgi:hypothetical protein
MYTGQFFFLRFHTLQRRCLSRTILDAIFAALLASAFVFSPAWTDQADIVFASYAGIGVIHCRDQSVTGANTGALFALEIMLPRSKRP